MVASSPIRNFSRRAFVGMAAAPLLSSCQPEIEPTSSSNEPQKDRITLSYKLSVAVADASSTFTGHSIIRVSWIDASKQLMNYGAATKVEVWGEAAVIDLGPDRGLLFALLHGPARRHELYFACDHSPLNSLPNAPQRDGRFGYNWAAINDLASTKGPLALQGNNVPFLVRFEDTSRPSTVVEVAPNEMDRHYGASFAFAGSSIEVVNEPPTSSIASVLPWAVTRSQTLAGGIPSAEPLTSALSPSNFRRWPKD